MLKSQSVPNFNLFCHLSITPSEMFHSKHFRTLQKKQIDAVQAVTFSMIGCEHEGLDQGLCYVCTDSVENM